MTAKVFIDGKEGTTGLQIYEKLGGRTDIELLTLPEELRKDPGARKEIMNRSDLVFLCLPDAAAIEAVALVENPDTRIIDASTAHRTAEGWVYGFPELEPGQADKIRRSKRTANPGCHATGFISLTAPLVKGGILAADAPLSCHSLTGYSGGGKKMIAEYEGEGRSPLLGAPRQYALGQEHKHLAEMRAETGLSSPPVFCPIVADFYSGMEVTVGLFGADLRGGAGPEDVKELYAARYTGPIVRFADGTDEGGFLSAAAFSGKDTMEIAVCGNKERMILTARYDNLGKGASGAAVECMNMVMGIDPTTGLEV